MSLAKRIDLFIFVCVLATTSATTSRLLNNSLEVPPDFVDFSFHFDVTSLPPIEFAEFVKFLVDVSSRFPIGKEVDFQASVCVKFYNGSGDPSTAFDLPQGINESEVNTLIKRAVARPTAANSACLLRNGTHQGPIGFQRFGGSGEVGDPWIDQAREYYSQERLHQEKKVAIVAVNSFSQPPSQVVLAIVDRSPIEMSNTSFRALAGQLALELATSLRAVFNQCEYEIQNSTCFVVASDRCAREERPWPTASVKKDIVPFCGLPPAIREIGQCDPKICADECEEQLNNATCVPDCGPGLQNLPSTGKYKYCPRLSNNCTSDPCPNTTLGSTPASTGEGAKARSRRAIIGQAFMGLGFVMFSVSAVGLLFMWLICGRQAKAGSSDDETQKIKGKKDAK